MVGFCCWFEAFFSCLRLSAFNGWVLLLVPWRRFLGDGGVAFSNSTVFHRRDLGLSRTGDGGDVTPFLKTT